MSHVLNRYVLTYTITVDAHDEDEAKDEAAMYLDAYSPDTIELEGDGDECLEYGCEDDEEDEDIGEVEIE